jgi:hypothetical protein
MATMVARKHDSAPVAVPNSQAATSRRLAAIQRKAKEFNDDRRGEFEIGNVLGIAFLIIGAVVTVLVVATLTPTYVSAVANATTAVSTADFGNALVNSLTSPMSLLIGIGGLFGIVLLILGAIALGRK